MARREILKRRMVASPVRIPVPVMFSLVHTVAMWMISVRELEQATEVATVAPMNFKMDSMARSEDRPPR